MNAVYITALICLTLIILAWIGRNDNDGGWRE